MRYAAGEHDEHGPVVLDEKTGLFYGPFADRATAERHAAAWNAA